MQLQRENNKMKTPEHFFWLTKKTVQRKLGSKEDEHIISSDAELDAKIFLYKSISGRSAELSKIIDQFQERLCILSQEECIFGRFLKEVGKRSKTTAQIITNMGKVISYSGQQRMCVRVPLLRLHHEVDVFRIRAVKDTYVTLNNMEKERTDYRAALSWMKSASSELDPDSGKGLDKFRTAQSHVRIAKQNFDCLAQDTIQKIDLLAAARCNMYSHALVTYMNELRQFAEKTASTFEAISKSLQQKPKYDFCVLKDLKQDEGDEKINEIVPIDNDQSLFFADDYMDEHKKLETATQNEPIEVNSEQILIELTQKVDESLNAINLIPQNIDETANFWPKWFTSNPQPEMHNATMTLNSNFSLGNTKETSLDNQQNAKSTKANHWMDLFADLDPLANPEAFDLKLRGGLNNAQQT